MILGYVRGTRINQQLDKLEEFGVEELFSDGTQAYDVFEEEQSEYQSLLHYAEPGDKVLVTSLDVLSRDYQRLIAILNEFEGLGLRLQVLSMPELSMSEWRGLFSWSLRNEQLLYPRLVKLGQEKNRNRNSYSIFSKDVEAKKLYREILWQVLGHERLKTIALQKGVPLETVYRVKQEADRIKLAFVLVICFFLAIFSVKMAESFFDSLWIQVIICIIATLVILYNTLADSNER